MTLGVANVLCRRTRILACLSSVSAETPEEHEPERRESCSADRSLHGFGPP